MQMRNLVQFNRWWMGSLTALILVTSLPGAGQTAEKWGYQESAPKHTLPSQEFTGPVTSVAFSPDGKIVLTGSDDGTAKLWDASSGQLLHSLDQDSSDLLSITVAYAPNGKTVFTSSQSFVGIAKLWDANTGQLLHILQGADSVGS